MKMDQKLLSALMLSTALTLGACNKKDKDASGAHEIASVAELSGKSVDAKAIAKLLEVDKRKVSEADAEAALGKMGLWEPDSGISWGNKEGGNGIYTYKDVSITSDDGETVTIGQLKLTGVHMEGDDPTFDRMDAQNLAVADEDGGVTIDNLSLARPSPKIGSGIMKALETVESIGDLDNLDIDIDLDDGEMAFGAIMLDGVKVKAEDVTVDMASAGWGEDEDTGKAVFLLNDLKLDGEDDGLPIKLTLGNISGSGVDMNQFRALMDDGIGSGSPGINSYTKAFDAFKLKDFNLTSDTLNIVSDGAVAVSTQKNGVTTTKQSLSPVRLFFSGEPKNPDMVELQNGLSGLGFEELEFSASQTSVLNEKTDTVEVTDAVVNLKDGFNLAYKYKGSGLKAMQENLENANNVASPADALAGFKLENLNIELTDYNLVDRMITFVAEQQGTSPALMRMQAKGGLMVLSLGAQNEDQGQALSDIGEALGKFIDDGGTLKIGLNPATPISADQFQNVDPQSINPNDFGFTIEHIK